MQFIAESTSGDVNKCIIHINEVLAIKYAELLKNFQQDHKVKKYSFDKTTIFKVFRH